MGMKWVWGGVDLVWERLCYMWVVVGSTRGKLVFTRVWVVHSRRWCFIRGRLGVGWSVMRVGWCGGVVL